MTARTVLVFALLAIAAPAAAQTTASTLSWGDEVRVWAPGLANQRIHGFLYGYMDDVVYVRDNRSNGELAIPVGEIRDFARLEIKSRPAAMKRNGRFGLFLGTAVGVLAGAGIASAAPHDQHTLWVVGSTVGGSLLGGAVGAGWGALFPRDHWQNYRIPTQSARQP